MREKEEKEIMNTKKEELGSFRVDVFRILCGLIKQL